MRGVGEERDVREVGGSEVGEAHFGGGRFAGGGLDVEPSGVGGRDDLAAPANRDLEQRGGLESDVVADAHGDEVVARGRVARGCDADVDALGEAVVDADAGDEALGAERRGERDLPAEEGQPGGVHGVAREVERGVGAGVVVNDDFEFKLAGGRPAQNGVGHGDGGAGVGARRRLRDDDGVVRAVVLDGAVGGGHAQAEGVGARRRAVVGDVDAEAQTLAGAALVGWGGLDDDLADLEIEEPIPDGDVPSLWRALDGEADDAALARVVVEVDGEVGAHLAGPHFEGADGGVEPDVAGALGERRRRLRGDGQSESDEQERDSCGAHTFGTTSTSNLRRARAKASVNR